MFYIFKRGNSNLTSHKALAVKSRIKLFPTSFFLAAIVTVIAWIVLTLTFRPDRYSGQAGKIQTELTTPDKNKPKSNPFVSHKGYSVQVDGNIKHFDENGTELTEQEYQSRRQEDIANNSERSATPPTATVAPGAETPMYVDRADSEAKTGKRLIFGGTAEFFQYCDNSETVTWNPGDIDESIRSREIYLRAKIRTILSIVFPASFIILYLFLLTKKLWSG